MMMMTEYLISTYTCNIVALLSHSRSFDEKNLTGRFDNSVFGFLDHPVICPLHQEYCTL